MPTNDSIQYPASDPMFAGMTFPERKKRTICVDFDGVIHSYTSPWTVPEEVRDPPTEGAFGFLREAVADGFEVVIQSVRATTQPGKDAIFRWLLEHGLGMEFASQIRITHEKPQALVYLDDRAVRFEGSFPVPSELAARKPWNR